MRTSTRLQAVLVPVVAVAASLLLAGCFQIAPPADDDTDPSIDASESADTGDTDDVDDEGETVDVFSIAVGDCINDGSSDETVTETTVVDCDAPHDSEIYADAQVPDGDFPGDEALGSQADTDCLDQFEGFIGLSYDESIYSVNYFVPTEGSWEQGDREILCLVGADGEQTSGTLEGIGE